MEDNPIFEMYMQDGARSEILFTTTSEYALRDAHADLCASGQVYDPGVLVCTRCTKAVGEVTLWTVQLEDGKWGRIPAQSGRDPVSWWYDLLRDKTELVLVQGDPAFGTDLYAPASLIARQKFLFRVFDRDRVFLPAAYAVLRGMVPSESPIFPLIQKAEQGQSSNLDHYYDCSTQEIHVKWLLEVLRKPTERPQRQYLWDILNRGIMAGFGDTPYADDTRENPQLNLRLLWQGVADPWEV